MTAAAARNGLGPQSLSSRLGSVEHPEIASSGLPGFFSLRPSYPRHNPYRGVTRHTLQSAG